MPEAVAPEEEALAEEALAEEVVDEEGAAKIILQLMTIINKQ